MLLLFFLHYSNSSIIHLSIQIDQRLFHFFDQLKCSLFHLFFSLWFNFSFLKFYFSFIFFEWAGQGQGQGQAQSQVQDSICSPQHRQSQPQRSENLPIHFHYSLLSHFSPMRILAFLSAIRFKFHHRTIRWSRQLRAHPVISKIFSNNKLIEIFHSIDSNYFFLFFS